jgi:hypothetical protein
VIPPLATDSLPEADAPRRIGALALPLTLTAVAVITCAHIASKLVLGAGIVDDTYIFLRYARNFADGLGFVFNPGERVEGYTSPLWTFLLSSIAALPLDLPTVAMLLSALFGLATAVSLFFFSRKYLPRSGWWLAVVPPLALATNPSFEYWTWSGMDTAIFTFLLFGTFWLFLEQARGAGLLLGAGACFFLSALARLEALALLPIYMAFIFCLGRQNKAQLWKKYASFLAPGVLLVGHFLWRHSYYDSWLPNTYYAKTGVPLSLLLERGLAYTASFMTAHAPHILVVLLALIIIVRSRLGVPDEWKLALSIILVWLGYVTYVGGDHFAMFRFYVPILPILFYLLGSSLASIVSRLSGSRRFALAAPGLAMVLLLMNVLIYYQHQGYRARGEVTQADGWAYVGTWIKRNVPPDSTIASMVVGAIPYYSGLRTYDVLGLTDRHIATRGKIYTQGAIGHQKYDTDYLLAQRPTYIVYSSSGLFAEPVDRSYRGASPYYFFALQDLVNHPRTAELYDFHAIRMDNGRYIEFLKLR